MTRLQRLARWVDDPANLGMMFALSVIIGLISVVGMIVFIVAITS